jgi:hypothetical protein
MSGVMSKRPAKAAAHAAPALTISERILLFCVASGTDWEHGGITGATVTTMVVRGLIERDAGNRLTLTDQGRAAFDALLAKEVERGALRPPDRADAPLASDASREKASGRLSLTPPRIASACLSTLCEKVGMLVERCDSIWEKSVNQSRRAGTRRAARLSSRLKMMAAGARCFSTTATSSRFFGPN